MSNISSLKEITSPDFSNPAFESRINEIMLGTFKWNYVLFEGKSDLLILNKFLSDKVKPISTGSKSIVEKIMARIAKLKNNVIGICDLDYDKSINPNLHIFYYDTNNLETFLILNNSIFSDNAFAFLGLGPKDIIKAKQDALIELYPLSIFRRIRITFDLDISIDDFCPLNDLYMRQTTAQNAYAIEYNILNKLLGVSPSDRRLIANEYKSEYSKSPADYYNNTQGHDFMKLFCLKIGCSDDSLVYEAFAKAFSNKYFLNSGIYKSIKNYERMETLSFLKV